MHDAELLPHKDVARTIYHRYWIAPRERKVLARASRVVAVSRYAAAVARRALLDVPVEVIPNAVDTQAFRPRAREVEPGAPFRLLYLGRWREMKGVGLLGPLARMLGPDYRIDVTGIPDDRSVRSGLPPNVHDIGVQRGQAAVIEALHRADALIVPSLSEGFGLVAIEAMACGVPVIASRLPAMLEIIEDGGTGILCTPGAVEEFARAAGNLRANEALRALKGARARQLAVDKFGINAMVDAYLTVYHQAMACRGRQVGQRP
jgi:glycosyltransferase involved in cell wall biosynthesis